MASMTVTQDRNAIISELYIAASPERVFQALVDPQQVVQWWGQAGIYRCTEFEGDVRPGGKWRCAGDGGQSGHFTVAGEYLEIDVPRLLVYSWMASWTGDFKTIVRWELEPTNDGTLVRIQHSGVAARPEVAQSYKGWPSMLDWLQAFLEKGETVAMRAPMSA